MQDPHKRKQPSTDTWNLPSEDSVQAKRPRSVPVPFAQQSPIHTQLPTQFLPITLPTQTPTPTLPPHLQAELSQLQALQTLLAGAGAIQQLSALSTAGIGALPLPSGLPPNIQLLSALSALDLQLKLKQLSALTALSFSPVSAPSPMSLFGLSSATHTPSPQPNPSISHGMAQPSPTRKQPEMPLGGMSGQYLSSPPVSLTPLSSFGGLAHTPSPLPSPSMGGRSSLVVSPFSSPTYKPPESPVGLGLAFSSSHSGSSSSSDPFLTPTRPRKSSTIEDREIKDGETYSVEPDDSDQPTLKLRIKVKKRPPTPGSDLVMSDQDPPGVPLRHPHEEALARIRGNRLVANQRMEEFISQQSQSDEKEHKEISPLKPPQLKAIHELCMRRKQKGELPTDAVFEFVTGAGKTRIFTKVIELDGGITVIVEPTDQLIDQTTDEILKHAPQFRGRIKKFLDSEHGNSKAKNKFFSETQIILMTYATFNAHAHKLPWQHVSTLVLDEAHHADQQYVQSAKIQNPFINVHRYTATPYMGKGKNARDCYADAGLRRKTSHSSSASHSHSRSPSLEENPITALEYKEAWEKKLIAPLINVSVYIPPPTGAENPTVEQIQHVALDIYVNGKYPSGKAYRDFSTIVSCNNIKQIKVMVDKFNGLPRDLFHDVENFNCEEYLREHFKSRTATQQEVLQERMKFHNEFRIAEPLHSKMSDKDRDAALKRYSEGKTLCLIGCNMIGEGFDAARATIHINLKNNNSSRIGIQGAGRIIRFKPNKVAVQIDCNTRGKHLRQFISEGCQFNYGDVASCLATHTPSTYPHFQVTDVAYRAISSADDVPEELKAKRTKPRQQINASPAELEILEATVRQSEQVIQEAQHTMAEFKKASPQKAKVKIEKKSKSPSTALKLNISDLPMRPETSTERAERLDAQQKRLARRMAQLHNPMPLTSARKLEYPTASHRPPSHSHTTFSSVQLEASTLTQSLAQGTQQLKKSIWELPYAQPVPLSKLGTQQSQALGQFGSGGFPVQPQTESSGSGFVGHGVHHRAPPLPPHFATPQMATGFSITDWGTSPVQTPPGGSGMLLPFGGKAPSLPTQRVPKPQRPPPSLSSLTPVHRSTNASPVQLAPHSGGMFKPPTRTKETLKKEETPVLDTQPTATSYTVLNSSPLPSSQSTNSFSF